MKLKKDFENRKRALSVTRQLPWVGLIVKLSALEKDYDSHFQCYTSQYLQFGSFFLTLAIDELKKRISKQNNIGGYYRVRLAHF